MKEQLYKEIQNQRYAQADEFCIELPITHKRMEFVQSETKKIHPSRLSVSEL